MRVVFALCLLWSTAAWSASPRVYALIIAENRGPDAGIPPLRYADDDGARYFELFADYADQAKLLAVLDAETQRQYHGVAEHTVVPTRDNVLRAFERMNEAMQADVKAGAEPVFYLLYTGHGGVGPDGDGFVTLHDGKLTRTQLYETIVAKSAAAYNHLIIDACDSYLFVNARGGADDTWVSDRRGATQAAAVAAYVSEQSLERYPNTGVLLSTSRASESHEWSRYAAGVFSYEVHSGLVGSADVNGDGRIDYSEIAAYVAAANLRVDDPRARLDIFARPPAMHHGEPLFDLRQLHASTFLKLDAGESGHLEIEDDRGVRYADFNKAPEHSVAIGLLPERSYYVRRGDDEVLLPRSASAGVIVPLTGRVWQSRTVSTRDATSDAFAQKLYTVPYGPSFYQGYVATSGEEAVALDGSDAFPAPTAAPMLAVSAMPETLVRTATLAQPASLTPWIITSAAVSAAAATGAILTFALRKTTTTVDNEPPVNGNIGNANANARAQTGTTSHTVTRGGSMVPTYILAGTAVATGVTALILFLADEPSPAIPTPRLGAPSLTLAPLVGGGAFAMGTFSF